MSYQGSLNPAQINPALLQAMAAAQVNNGGVAALPPPPNNPAAFQSWHQTFQRLQSQEVQKLDPSRQSSPSQQSQQLQPSQNQAAQQAQFFQMMQASQNMSQEQLASGMNIHSQQQGLTLPGMPENEQGRRQMLQNMLSQQLQQMPDLQQQNPQPPAPRPTSEQMRDFVARHPNILNQLQQRHANNQQAMLVELQQLASAGAAARPLMPINLQQLQQSPQQQQQQQQQQQGAPLQRTIRMDQFANLQNTQGMPTGQLGQIDQKQMEALQAMKAAQQRGGGFNTPSQQNLPFPQQPGSQGQQTPQLPQTQAFGTPPQSSQGVNGQAVTPSSSRAGEVQAMIQGWGDTQLLKSTQAVVSKVTAQSTAPADPTKFHLLQIIAEWKRRNKSPPNEAIHAAGQALGNPGLISQLANVDWATLANFARARADSVSIQRDGLALGSTINPIDITTPVQPSTQTPQQFTTPIQNPTPQFSVGSGSTPIPASPQPKTRPWATMDFRNELMTMDEAQFWGLLSAKDGFVPPSIDGRSVNLFLLFKLVHRNGGAAKIYGNLSAWQFLGGYLGFPTETVPDQPSRASSQIANQLRNYYLQFIQPLEDMFYGKLYRDRLAAAADGTQAIPVPVPPKPQTPNAQTPTAGLTEQQKKMLDEVRKQVQPQEGSPSSLVPMTPGKVVTPDAFEGMTNPDQIRLIKANPAYALMWTRSKERAMRKKFPKELRDLPDEEKPRFVAELRNLLPVAKEAQDKAPRLLLISLESSMEQLQAVTALISMYMFIFIALQHAETGRFPFNLVDLAKLREPINRTLSKLNNLHKQMLVTPEGQATLQRILPPLEALIAQQNAAGSMAPPSTVPISEEIASKLPKGLRMEDLKPPPTKRQKGNRASVGTNAGSPASPAFTSTPEAARTPGSPGGQTYKKPGSVKRKRQPSRSMDISNALANNALGINLDEHAPFFAAHEALRTDPPEISTSNPTETNDVWATLLSALDAYQANPSAPNINPSALPNAPSAPDPGLSMPEDDLFEQFLDTSKMGDDSSWAIPTPELFRVASIDEGSTTSPESIRTVAKTPADEVRIPSQVASGGKALDPTIILGGPGSPENQAYNGSIFASWGDEVLSGAS